MSKGRFTDPWAEEKIGDLRQRLAAVGATYAEIIAFEEQFLHDPTWDHAEKERLVALGDGKLRAEVVSARQDGYRDTETDDDERARLADEAHRLARSVERTVAEEMSAFEPGQILDWVGVDASRAQAMLAVERAHPMPRPGLISVLRERAGE